MVSRQTRLAERVANLMSIAAVIAWTEAACTSRGQTPDDGGVDYVPIDTALPTDTGPKPLALDFSATGCAAFDLSTSRCVGVAPLNLTFTPIASEGLIRFLWTFGDETPVSSERSPTHLYTLPGSYDVMLSAGGGEGAGSLQRVHAGYVQVARAPVGAVCDVDEQCQTDLTCWCGSAKPCAPVLPRGICTRSCEAGAAGPTACPDSTVCADLTAGPVSTPPSTPNPGAAWRQPLCLPACAKDSDCRSGFRCRDLLAGPTGNKWIRACFTSYPLDVGARCNDAAGKAIDADCAGRLCADLGAHGRCSADCSATACPSGTACAHFGDGRNLCLVPCTTSRCDDDPLLACEPPGVSGALGFTVTTTLVNPAETPRFCAPKRCASNNDCSPTGTCSNGHCRRNN